ncbi:hypothetical protein CBF23_014595 [Marinomonas agarivorans]|nr:hypothetical protein CBF23_014595 [Marinomonas agarivorans]
MSIESDIYKFVFYIILVAGCFGVLLKMYEHFILHGLLSQPSFFAYKLSRMQNQLNSGLIGVLSALTYPFGLVALMLNIKFQYLTGVVKKTAIWLIGCFWFFDAVFLSSLTTIMYLFAFLFITIILNNALNRDQFTHISWLKLLIGLMVVISYFIYLTFFRVDLDFIPIALEARALIPNFDIDSVFVFAIINFLHYLVHGVVEWFRLFNHVGLDVHYLGAYQFYPIVKIFSVFGLNIPSFLELAAVAHKTGVYTTFFGGFILDFGYYSFLAAFVLGVLSMSLYNGLFNASFVSYLVYPILAAQLLFSSIMNIFSGVVVYYLVSVLLSVVLLHTYKRHE